MSHGLRPIGPKHFVATTKSVALAREPAADDLLGAARGGEVAAERIDVGGVEERDARVGGVVEDRARRVLVDLQAEGHRAEADARHLEAGAAEPYVLHVRDVAPRG